MTPFGKALIKARKLIESGQKKYICSALESVGGSEFIEIIMGYLDGCYTYQIWLRINHQDDYEIMDDQDFHQGRLQWMDYMIEQESYK